VLTAVVALADAVLAVVTAALALVEAVFAVATAASALVSAELAVVTAELAVVTAEFAVLTADPAVVLAVTTSKSASCTAKCDWVKLLFRSSALMAEPGKNVAFNVLISVSRKIRMATPLAGAVLNESVVALANVNAVVAAVSSVTLTSPCLMYSNVNE